MKRADFSAEAWEQRVFALLSTHPDTVSVTDVRHLPSSRRHGADGIWIIDQAGKRLEVPFAIYIASPGTREVRFEIAVHHGRKMVPGAALSEVVQLVLVCSPESRSMLTLPAHALRELLIERKDFARSSTPVGQDAKGTYLSERFLVPLTDLALLDGATVSSPDSW